MKSFLSLAVLVLILVIAPGHPGVCQDKLLFPLAPAHYTLITPTGPAAAKTAAFSRGPELAKTSSFFPLAWNLIAPTLPKPAETGFGPVGQIPLPLAPAQPWNHFDPLAIEGKGYPGQIPLPLVSVQIQGDQIPGIWMCKDKNWDTVFSNRTGQYEECRPYVVSPGLREAFLKEMLLKRKQHAPQHVIPDQSNANTTVIGPL